MATRRGSSRSPSPTRPSPYARAAMAARRIGDFTGHAAHDACVVLGSGWAEAETLLGDAGEAISYGDIPGFPLPTALGHPGHLRSVRVGLLRVLVLSGRSHLYEGHEPDVVAHGVRAAILTGCRVVILTNSAGSLVPEWRTGAPVLIRDHINLTGRSPLAGPPPPAPWGDRFCDLTDAYSPRLRAIARVVDPSLDEGVYVGWPGPHFETPAEVLASRALGGHLVGMSTVLETIAARHMRAEVLGISLVTNPAAGLSSSGPSGDEVVGVARASAPRVAALVAGVLQRV